jgi:hypothetical protein
MARKKTRSEIGPKKPIIHSEETTARDVRTFFEHIAKMGGPQTCEHKRICLMNRVAAAVVAKMDKDGVHEKTLTKEESRYWLRKGTLQILSMTSPEFLKVVSEKGYSLKRRLTPEEIERLFAEFSTPGLAIQHEIEAVQRELNQIPIQQARLAERLRQLTSEAS